MPLEAPPGAGPAPGPSDRAWLIERIADDPGQVHARPLPGDGRRRLTVVEPTTAAVVLGSTQPVEVVRPGERWVRRRGGGGAVWVEPGVGWFELFVPTADPLWDPDVGRAFWLAGEVCADVLEPILGVRPHVHRGPLRAGPWSSLVCFAGTGPGEVFVGGRKLVGFTQRRTRAGSRFSGIVYDRWDPAALLDRLALAPERARTAAIDLGAAGIGLGELTTTTATELVAGLARHLA